jgi:hypothetical protein
MRETHDPGVTHDFAKMGRDVVNELMLTSQLHSGYTMAEPRDPGNARPVDLHAMGHKGPPRRATLIKNAEGPPALVIGNVAYPNADQLLGNTDVNDACPGCTSAYHPGSPAEHPSETLARRRTS